MKRKLSSKLILVPTPLDEEKSLSVETVSVLKEALEKGDSLFLVEDIKPGRRRWLNAGLPRDHVEKLVCYNEHTREKLRAEMIAELQKGKNLYLMSDGGMPALCDPGARLIDECHQRGISVDCLAFDNSMMLALALSGFAHESFHFYGFPPAKAQERKDFWHKLKGQQTLGIVMDTPYRLSKVVEEIKALGERQVFFAFDLQSDEQAYWRGPAGQFPMKIIEQKRKREFILVIK